MSRGVKGEQKRRQNPGLFSRDGQGVICSSRNGQGVKKITFVKKIVILKAGVTGLETHQIIWNFPLRARKVPAIFFAFRMFGNDEEVQEKLRFDL